MNWIGISPSLKLAQNIKNTSPGTATARCMTTFHIKKVVMGVPRELFKTVESCLISRTMGKTRIKNGRESRNFNDEKEKKGR